METLKTGDTMTNGGHERALESAERSWKAALAHMESGDLITAGALIRLTGKYVQLMGEEQGQTVGAVVPFPRKEARAERQGGHESLPARTLHTRPELGSFSECEFG